MDLVKSTDTRYEIYEALLLERDQVRKEAGQIWTAYMGLFGHLITRIYEEKVECVKHKKALSYCQMAINRGGKLNSAELQAYLEEEMAAYQANLEQLLKDYDACKNAGLSTAYEVQRSKTLYRRLAKKLHPDINPETAKNETLKELWQRVMTAYAHNDVKELAELEVLVGKVLREIGAGEIRIDIPDIEEKIDALREEIEKIRSTEPYTYKELTNSQEKTDEKLLALESELETYRKYRGELEQALQEMLDSGRITIDGK